jgi:hypothetical protein
LSAAGRTFEARVGFAPAATTDERDALSSAFASMSFAASGRGVAAAVLGHGIAGGEPWTLTAQRTEGRLSLSLEAETLGTGASFVSPATSKLQPASTVLGQGSDRQLVAFGAIPIDVIRVEATAADGSVVSAEVFDIPDELDADSNAFALVAAPGPVELLGYDASGEVVAHGTVDAAEPAPFPGASLQDGRHFGYVRGVDVDAGTDRVRPRLLLVRQGGERRVSRGRRHRSRAERLLRRQRQPETPNARARLRRAGCAYSTGTTAARRSSTATSRSSRERLATRRTSPTGD